MSLFTSLVSGFALQKLPLIQFDEGYTQLFGDQNLIVHRDGKSVRLTLDERTGSGFVSNDIYLHGFFSSSIKLPADYSAGVVIAFYVSNNL
jgi:xyloglucan:xyloglucosyl transferase